MKKKRKIEVTCRLCDADYIISKLIGERSTKDLQVTIPIEIEDDAEIYKFLSINNKIDNWDFIKEEEPEISTESLGKNEAISENKEEEKPKEDEGTRESICKVMIGPRGVDLYSLLTIMAEIALKSPSIIPFTKTWENKYYFHKSTDRDTLFNETVLKYCDILMLDKGVSILKDPLSFFDNIWKKMKEHIKETEEDVNVTSMLKKVLSSLWQM